MLRNSTKRYYIIVFVLHKSKNISHNKYVFENTSKDTSPFVAQDIHFDTCPHFNYQQTQVKQLVIIHKCHWFNQNMLIELYVSDYVTLDGLVNGVDGAFPDYTWHHQNHNMDRVFKPMCWI
jgi:hypothetical protein